MYAKKKTLEQQMKVSELSKESKVAPSAIHYYIRMGILHRPTKAGLNLHLYDESHLARLRLIRQLKEKKGLSLAEIRKVLERAGEPAEGSAPSADGKAESRQFAAASAAEGQEGGKSEGQENREKILDMAIRLFSERGYENTKVSDIIEALRMGKGTFYVYFKNKRELFLDCIDRLGVAIVPRESWNEIRQEQDFVARNKKRGIAFLKAFPGYRGILNLARGAIGGADPVMAQKAIEAFRVLSRPMLKDLRRAVASGAVRINHDEAFTAFLLLIIAEAFGYWQMIDPRYSIEEAVQIITDIMQNGLVDTPPFISERGSKKGPPGEVEDRARVKIRLRDIAVDGSRALRGRMGDAEADVDLNRLSAASFCEEGERLLARLKTREGQELEIEVDGNRQLSGVAAFGSMRIPLKSIVSLQFGEG
jgi:AcrR family transcriptional regulator